VKVLSTLVSADWYQKYLPLYHYCAAKNLPEWTVRTFVRGAIDPVVHKCYDAIEATGWKNIERPIPDVLTPSTGASSNPYSTNACRWFLGRDRFEDLAPECVLMTDADLLLFVDPFTWHAAQVEQSGNAYAGHRGPRKRPYRPEISEQGWRGDFERVAGGFVYMTPRWFTLTEGVAKQYQDAVWGGALPFPPFREMDEVMLARIVKESGQHMPPPDARFPTELRGVHLGDFRPNMTHRWTNMAKMHTKLRNINCNSFRRMEQDPAWRTMCSLLEADENIKTVLDNLRTHIARRL
jgi:hypothetical protein